MPALGDDSGLDVDALNGCPGIFSARYAGEDATDAERIAKLLEELRTNGAVTKENRSARFRCALALVYPDGRTEFAESSLEGHILGESQGTAGFGYDPIVYLESIGSTLAEVDFDVTCTRGFRALAAKKLFSKLIVTAHEGKI